jgi:hypothetical protein
MCEVPQLDPAGEDPNLFLRRRRAGTDVARLFWEAFPKHSEVTGIPVASCRNAKDRDNGEGRF